MRCSSGPDQDTIRSGSLISVKVFDHVYNVQYYHSIPYLALPYHTIPYQTRPDHTIPYQTRPDQTAPGQARPGQARPDQARPDQNRPNQARPGQATPSHSIPRYASHGKFTLTYAVTLIVALALTNSNTTIAGTSCSSPKHTVPYREAADVFCSHRATAHRAADALLTLLSRRGRSRSGGS